MRRSRLDGTRLSLIGATFLCGGHREAVANPLAWTSRTVVDGAYTSTVFPGYSRSTPDQFLTLDMAASTRARLSKGFRLEMGAGVRAERYRRWEERNAERFESELKLRSGSWRAHLRGRLVPELLLFPDQIGNATYRDREGLISLETTVPKVCAAKLELRSESQNYDSAHSGRNCLRTRWGYSLAFQPREKLKGSLLFENERSRASDSNYDFYQNQLTIGVEALLGVLSLRGEMTRGIRNYFPNSLFNSNYRRRDHNQTFRIWLRKELMSGVELSFMDEVRARNSTRADRDYDQNTIIAGLAYSLGQGSSH